MNINPTPSAAEPRAAVTHYYPKNGKTVLCGLSYYHPTGSSFALNPAAVTCPECQRLLKERNG